MPTKSESTTAVSNKLKDYMEKRSITVSKLAEKTGVSQATISGIRNNKVDFQFTTAIKLAKGLRVTLDALAGRSVATSKQLEDLRAISDQLSDAVWK